MVSSSIMSLAVVILTFSSGLFLPIYSFNIGPSPPCWNQPINVTCATNSTVSGNLAFPIFYNPFIRSRGPVVASYFSTYSAGFSTIDVNDYHITISYLFCVDSQYQNQFRNSLFSFAWSSFPIRMNQVCCEDSYVEACVDQDSQYRIGNFSSALIAHATASGVVFPDFFAAQPPYHCSLGFYNSTYDVSGAFSGAVPTIDVTVSVDTFYFGSLPFFAQDYIEPGGTSTLIYVAIAVAGAALIAFIILLATPCGRHCLKGTCPACCCPSECCKSW